MSNCKHENLKCRDCFREVQRSELVPVWLGVDWAELGGSYSVETPVPVEQPKTKRTDNLPVPDYPIGGMLK